MWDELLASLPGGGADLVVDCVGAPYLDGNLRLLRDGGELVLIGDLGGSVGPIDLGRVIDKWAVTRA